MREEYRKLGLPLAPHKQLELLLFHVRPRIDTNKISHRLIQRFGSLQGVFEATVCELTEIEGIGKSTAEYLNLVGDIAQAVKVSFPVKPGTPLDSPERVEVFVRDQLKAEKSECILAAYLDPKQRLICERLARDSAGSSARVENSTRVTVSSALRYNASSVLIGHNHPNGCPLPSAKDVSEARRLRDALRGVGIALEDFVIIGEDGEAYSLVRGGLLY